MHIDWGQIVTQAIGFLIAVWLLKRYAWSSLLGFVEKRRETIASAFEEIESQKAENAEQKRQYDLELQNIEATRREKIQTAAAEAEQLANDIKEEARRDVPCCTAASLDAFGLAALAAARRLSSALIARLPSLALSA